MINNNIPWPDIHINNGIGRVPLKENYAFEDMWYLDTPQALPIFEKQADIIIEHQSKGIVDIGCRHGPILDILYKRGYTNFKYMGFDTSEEPIRLAQEKWTNSNNIEFRNESWENMETFIVDFDVDQVIWSGVLLYKPEDHFNFFNNITKDFYNARNAIIQEPCNDQKYWDERLILNTISEEFEIYKKEYKSFKEHIINAEIFAGRRMIIDIEL